VNPGNADASNVAPDLGGGSEGGGDHD